MADNTQGVSKHEAVREYFSDKIQELTSSALGFNYSPDTESVAIIPQYSDRNVRDYINGDRQRQYSFSFIIVRPYSSDPLDVLNTEAMELGQAFMDWIEQQDEAGDYPDFGEGCEVERMEVLQNMPNLASVNAKEGIARYMIQGRIIYREYAE